MMTHSYFLDLRFLQVNQLNYLNMKKITLLLFLLAGTASLHGQDYVPLLDTNKVWNIFEDYFTWGNTYPHYLARCETDTTRFIVKKKFTEQVIAELGYLREDTVTKKVYYTNINEGNEVLLYDFSLEEGDILQGMEVIKVDSIKLLDGTYRKRIVFHNYYNTWIEGIGNLLGGLLWIDWYWDFKMHPPVAWLFCYFVNDTLLYRNDDYFHFIDGCDYSFTNVNTETIDNTYIPKIYPNPFSKKVSISLNDLLQGETFELAIKTLDGRTVYHETLVSDIAIDLSFLGKGIYLLSIKNKHFQFTEKIIKL